MVMPTETSATTAAAVPGEHRHHRAHRAAQRAGVLLGERPARRRRAEVADERLADLGRVGVRVAGAVQPHHHHEVGAGVAAYLLGERLDASATGSGVRSAARTCGVSATATATASARSRAPAIWAAAGVGVGQRDRADDDHQHDQHLQHAGSAARRCCRAGSGAPHALCPRRIRAAA